MFYQPCCGIIHDVHMEMTLVHSFHSENRKEWSTTSRITVKRRDQQHANANFNVNVQKSQTVHTCFKDKESQDVKKVSMKKSDLNSLVLFRVTSANAFHK